MKKARTAYILGLGKSGLAALEYLQKQGFSVIGIDANAAALKQTLNLSALVGENEVKELDSTALFVKSPGIAWEHPLVKLALQNKLEITSEIELGLDELYKRGKKLYAITGSNGKTTTTTLVAHILNQAGKKATPCGNVGLPLLSCLDRDSDIYVVELSSYQIEQLKHPTFSGGVILNISPNHQDRYQSFESYQAAKFRLVELLLPEAQLFWAINSYLLKSSLPRPALWFSSKIMKCLCALKLLDMRRG